MREVQFIVKDGHLKLNDLNLVILALTLLQNLKQLLIVGQIAQKIMKEFHHPGIEASEIAKGERMTKMIEDYIEGLSIVIDLDFVTPQSTGIYSEILSFEEIKESLENLRDYLYQIQILIYRDHVKDKELIEKYDREYSEIKKDLEIVQYMIRELLCAPGLFMEGSELANYIFNYPKIMGESIVPYYVIPKPFVPDEDEVQRILDVLKDLDLDDYE